MSKSQFLIIYFLVVIFFCLIIILIKVIMNLNKKKKISTKEFSEKDYEKIHRQAERNKWNKEIQSEFKGEINYKSNKKVKVLIGDYNKYSAIFTNSTLKSMDIETFVVPTARDIIDLVSNGSNYDIIITNNTYPRGEDSGFLLNSLKEIEYFNIPIIVLTVDRNVIELHKEKGLPECIEKPINEKNVIKSFSKVIKGIKFTKIKSNNSK